MNQEISIQIILESPPPGVDFGIQEGRGNQYKTIQKQRSVTGNLCFECRIEVKRTKLNQYDFSGPFVHGVLNERFIYIDIGTCAGQLDSIWTRRLKIPLKEIVPETIDLLLGDANLMLATKVPGKAKDGGPNCATVKPFSGWQVTRR